MIEPAEVPFPANETSFSVFCAVLEKIRKKKNHRSEQEKILMKFVSDFRLKVANISGEKNSSFYPILRLLLPACERERKPYDMKEFKLGKRLVKVLSLDSSSRDAQSLCNFRSSANTAQDGDFAGVAYFILQKRITQKTPVLTIRDINNILDTIANAEVGNKDPILDSAFSHAFKKLTGAEFKWFLRLILKDLKLGMSQDRILDCFHQDAPELYKNCTDLYKVCEELEDGNTRPSDQGVELSYAVKPMLSKRLNITEIHQLPFNITYHIEDKFDGERFQMHMNNGVFDYFTRKGHPYTHKYGKTFASGLLTPYLKDCFSKDAQNFILDGEMMGWHKEDNYFGCQAMYDIKKITVNYIFRPCYCVYDILYYNGKSLIGTAEKGGLTLKARLKILDDLFSDIPGVIVHSKREIVKDRLDILNALNRAIDNKDEGIVLKEVDSYYIVNQRNAGWYKIKPEYTDGAMTDLDLVIIGADEAENKRQGRAKSFHIACIDVAPGETNQRWVSVGNVATGFNAEQKGLVCALLERNWKSSKKVPSPPCLVFGRKKPDFWILPEHSIVLQVKATSLLRHGARGAGGAGASFALLCPRVQLVRSDKPVADVMTLHQLHELAEKNKTDAVTQSKSGDNESAATTPSLLRNSIIKLSTKRISESQLEQVEVKTRRKTTAKVIEVPEQFRSKASGNVQAISKALHGRKLCILTDDDDCKKPDLIRIIETHGGKHVENPGPDTWCCVAGTLNNRVNRFIDTQQLDIITTSWLKSLPISETLCSLSPLDMLSLKKETKALLSYDYDSFGDSYKEDIDEEALKKCLTRMDADIPLYPTEEEMLKLDKKLFGESNPFSFLRTCSICVLHTPFLGTLARMYGARVSRSIEDNLTHLVISKKERYDETWKGNEALRNTKIVSDEWLETCIRNKKLLSYTDFLL